MQRGASSPSRGSALAALCRPRAPPGGAALHGAFPVPFRRVLKADPSGSFRLGRDAEIRSRGDELKPRWTRPGAALLCTDGAAHGLHAPVSCAVQPWSFGLPCAPGSSTQCSYGNRPQKAIGCRCVQDFGFPLRNFGQVSLQRFLHPGFLAV